MAFRLFRAARVRLLWRVRRKLILSYVFMGVLPALLIVTFFLLCGLLLFFNVSSYLMQSRMRALEDEARFLARSGALELKDAAPGAETAAVLARRQAVEEAKYPGISYVVVPAGRCATGDSAAPAPAPSTQAGPWAHLPPPTAVPAWIPCTGYGGLVAYRIATVAGGDEAQTQMVVRAVGRADDPASPYALVIDVPVGAEVAHRFRDETGIDISSVTTLSSSAGTVPDVPAMPYDPEVRLRLFLPTGGIVLASDPSVGSWNLVRRPFDWVSVLNYSDWTTGEAGAVFASIRMSVADIYDRISATPIRQFGSFSFGQLLLAGLATVAVSFLVIQSVALGMGFGLARSITGSVHELFAGTERVRRGDFTNKIAIRSRDQLGELAESFNSMTASIEDLLQQKAEKERLEQELRIARQIQMSLLPQGPLRMSGLSLSGHCEPAREVGGDYYDFLPLDGNRVGILIADVAGKGTSAALYMAELKGLMLSLSRHHRSPRALLVDADRILAPHLDDCSFITMTYAVVDLEARTLTYARAGHCPMIHLPAASALTAAPGVRRAQVETPDGMVLGLKIDNGEMFERLLVEVTVPLAAGDLFLLFTDGLSEAMNSAGDCFGEARLAALVEEHADVEPDVLRERILREIDAFTGAAPQHDDMTMLLVKME